MHWFGETLRSARCKQFGSHTGFMVGDHAGSAEHVQRGAPNANYSKAVAKSDFQHLTQLLVMLVMPTMLPLHATAAECVAGDANDSGTTS